MGKAHRAYALTGAIATAAAAKIEGTVVHAVSRPADGPDVTFRHPSGLLTIHVEMEKVDTPRVQWVGVVRTARRLMEGFVLVPDILLRRQAANDPKTGSIAGSRS
jgi:2-methylaconitate cis-trans-isomerase PrpF